MLQELTTSNLLHIASGAIIVIAIYFVDRIVRRAIGKYSQKVKLDTHVENILKMVARIIVVAMGLIALMSTFGLPTEWFVSVSALTGAAIGFASTQTVGNFLAGMYIMLSRPFMVDDYVKIGDVEGEVREITINYTKIFTPTYNITEIPNRKVLDSIITNYSGKKNIIDYSFSMGFPHTADITNEELIKECITPTIEKFHDKYKDVLPEKPQVSMSKFDRLGREVFIRMFFPEKKVVKFYDLQPELMQIIANEWDTYKAQKNL
jgi:small-conductance mechanosensitive channel